MLEAVSDEDDTLLEKYLEGKEISPAEIKVVLRRAALKVEHRSGIVRFII